MYIYKIKKKKFKRIIYTEYVKQIHISYFVECKVIISNCRMGTFGGVEAEGIPNTLTL